MKIYDLTITINNETLKWPSDPDIEIKKFLSIKNGDKVNLSILKLGSHTGTHIDAPFHFLKNGKSIDKIDIKNLIGKCFVKFVNSDVITIEEIKDIDYKNYDKILFKTKNSKYLKKVKFFKNYVYLSKEAAGFLVKKKVKLIGIDYLSIEGFGSVDNYVHKILLKNEVIIIEGLDMSKVGEGEYFLISLPLKLGGLDGSPARVILIKDFNIYKEII